MTSLTCNFLFVLVVGMTNLANVWCFVLYIYYIDIYFFTADKLALTGYDSNQLALLLVKRLRLFLCKMAL